MKWRKKDSEVKVKNAILWREQRGLVLQDATRSWKISRLKTNTPTRSDSKRTEKSETFSRMEVHAESDNPAGLYQNGSGISFEIGQLRHPIARPHNSGVLLNGGQWWLTGSESAVCDIRLPPKTSSVLINTFPGNKTKRYGTHRLSGPIIQPDAENFA